MFEQEVKSSREIGILVPFCILTIQNTLGVYIITFQDAEYGSFSDDTDNR